MDKFTVSLTDINTPPPFPVLELNVEFVMVVFELLPRRMAPPVNPILPVNTELLIAIEPKLAMAPPCPMISAVVSVAGILGTALFVNVEPETVKFEAL